MKTTRILAIALPAALFGAGTILCWQWFYRSTGQGRGTNPVKQEFIPAQVLSLRDAAGDLLGSLDVGSGSVILSLHTHGETSVTATVYSDSSRVFLQCLGPSGGGNIFVRTNSVEISDLKQGYVLGEWPISTLDRLRNAFLPSQGKRFDDDWILPTEDLRLQDRQGWLFASLGLSGNGDPGLAVADANHNVRMAWVQRNLLNEYWWDLAVFDESGHTRLSLQVRPGEAPDLVFYADSVGLPSVPDFATHKLVARGGSRASGLEWFPAMLQFRPKTPIQLQDNRGHLIWSAP